MRRAHIRLVVALVVASLLATVLVYTAIAGKTRVLQVSEVLAKPGTATGDVRLNGYVVQHAPTADGGLRFVLEDNATHRGRLTVLYRGSIPDAFRDGRSILVDGTLRNGVFEGKRDSLSTKCPSKYQAKPPGSGNS